MAQSDDLIGRQFDNYIVMSRLARGGMADVYLARHTRLEREVALKVMLPSFVENEAFVERFRREALAMARLQHNGIVQVYDTGDTPDGRPYIAMQYVRGGTLEELLAELENNGQIMTPAFALTLMRQVVDALQAAHSTGIIHRDLKPSNILLNEHRRPILTDLGIAYVQDTRRLTRTDTFIGTPHYMPPEQAKGQPQDARSDIYSLGVILFEMLAGQRPFPGDSHYSLIHQHVSVEPPSITAVRPGLSQQVGRIIARCLEKDPARRYQSAAQLAAALDGALAAEGVAGGRTPSGEWHWNSPGGGGPFTVREGRLRVPTAAGAKAGGKMWLWLGLGALVLLLAGGFWALADGPAPSTSPPTMIAAKDTAAPAPATNTVIAVTDIIATATVANTSTPAPAAGNPVTDEPTITAEPPTVTVEPPAITDTPPDPEGPATARVIRNVFTRSGPGMVYPQRGSLAMGDVVEVLGRDARGDWFVVQLRNDVMWVSAGFIEPVSGSLNDIDPAATIPPRPTATPTSPPPTSPPPTSPPPQPPPNSGGGPTLTPAPNLPTPRP